MRILIITLTTRWLELIDMDREDKYRGFNLTIGKIRNKNIFIFFKILLYRNKLNYVSEIILFSTEFRPTDIEL